MSRLFGNEVTMDEKALDLLWERQNITAMNIANVDTPHYKAQRLTFEQELSRRIRSTAGTGEDAAHTEHAIQRASGSVETDPNESSRLDGNNVDMDQEQVDLVKTAYQYQMLVNSISGDLKRLDSAAKSF